MNMVNRPIGDNRNRKEKFNIATDYVDRLLKYLPSVDSFSMSEIIWKNENDLSDLEKKEAQSVQQEIEVLLEKTFRYADRNQYLSLRIGLNDIGRKAKEYGGHYRYINRNMKSNDYVISILKYFESKGNSGAYKIEDILRELHFDITLADGIQSKMNKAGLIDCTFSGCFIKEAGKQHLMEYKLDGHTDPIKSSDQRSVVSMVFNAAVHGNIATGNAGATNQSLSTHLQNETPQAKPINKKIKSIGIFIISNVWKIVIAVISTAVLIWLGLKK